MAYICTRPPNSCKGCEHYRFDPDRMQNSCWALSDMKATAKTKQTTDKEKK